MSEARYVPNQLLSRLVGLRLFSVQFVMDYVQLRFDGPGDEAPVLNCDVWPHVEFDGVRYVESDLGYADALRHLIPGTVLETTEATGSGLCITLDSGKLVLHPRLDEVFVEIAMLSGFSDRSWMVWRPGEDSFEDLV